MSSEKNTPAYVAYHVKDRFFTKIGVAWRTKKGDGLNVVLDVLPTDGRFVLLEPKAAKSAKSAVPAEAA